MAKVPSTHANGGCHGRLRRKRGSCCGMAEEQTIALLRQARDALEAYLFANDGPSYEAALALCDRISEHLSGTNRGEEDLGETALDTVHQR
jgi:hypothetical protein